MCPRGYELGPFMNVLWWPGWNRGVDDRRVLCNNKCITQDRKWHVFPLFCSYWQHRVRSDEGLNIEQGWGRFLLTPMPSSILLISPILHCFPYWFLLFRVWGRGEVSPLMNTWVNREYKNTITRATAEEPQHIHTISHIFVYFEFSILSQLKFYNNWGLTDSLLTVQTECT